MRQIRVFIDADNDRILFAEKCDSGKSSCLECTFANNHNEEQLNDACKFCETNFTADEKMINVIYGNLAKAVLGFMEGKEDIIREGISGVREKINPVQKENTIYEQIEEIAFSSGMRYGPAAALSILSLRNSDDIEMVNECIRLLERHKMYLKSLHPMRKEDMKDA